MNITPFHIKDGILHTGRFDIHVEIKGHTDEWDGCLVANIEKLDVNRVLDKDTNKEAYIIHH